MSIIIDRADGRMVGQLGPEDLDLLHRHLVDEYEGDADYHLTTATLEMLKEQGLTDEAVGILEQALNGRPTTEIGIEPLLEEPPFRLIGCLQSSDEVPLGGLRVDLVDRAGSGLGWAFSREDGVFKLASDQPLTNNETYEMLISARGSLLLLALDIDQLEPGEIELEPTTIRVGTGKVVTQDGKGLTGARVEMEGSWTVTTEDGSFILPMDSSAEAGRIDLEVFAPSGEPLGDYWTQDVKAETSVDLAQFEVPAPNPEWPETDPEMVASLGQPGDSLYPGVSRFPLS